MKYEVAAKVRGINATGEFYPVTFIVDANGSHDAKRQ